MVLKRAKQGYRAALAKNPHEWQHQLWFRPTASKRSGSELPPKKTVHVPATCAGRGFTLIAEIDPRFEAHTVPARFEIGQRKGHHDSH